MTAPTLTGEHVAAGHLDYYLRHGLNPVRYDMTNLAWHFQRRASLYRSLGIHPVTVRGARVLEVAAGSGQNSLYLASLCPRRLMLVEPNPAGIRDIQALYAEPAFAAWRPELFAGTLQDFHPGQTFDLVLCENWLGQRPDERALLRRLGTLVAPGGLLVVTCVAPLGFLPNVLRRLLAVRLGCWKRPFTEATRVLDEAFRPHLATVAAMTRTCVDWLQDNLLNPHYFNICLTPPMVLADLGQEFAVTGSSPDFATDWRWFKALYGPGRDFNGQFLAEYHRNVHNFLDYRRALPPGDRDINRTLEAAATALIDTAAQLDEAARTGATCSAADHAGLGTHLHDIIAAVETCCPDLVRPLREFEQVHGLPRVRPEDVGGMTAFAGLFGRETIYVSLEKASGS